MLLSYFLLGLLAIGVESLSGPDSPTYKAAIVEYSPYVAQSIGVTRPKALKLMLKNVAAYEVRIR